MSAPGRTSIQRGRTFKKWDLGLHSEIPDDWGAVISSESLDRASRAPWGKQEFTGALLFSLARSTTTPLRESSDRLESPESLQSQAHFRLAAENARLQKHIAQLESAIRHRVGVRYLHGVRVPVVMKSFATEIARSRQILALEDDWDGEGSPGYKEPTWRRAVSFVTAHAIRWLEGTASEIPTPRIEPGPHGSIDVRWRTPAKELLINFPVDPNLPAGFYGDNGAGGYSVKGVIDAEKPADWLFAWLCGE